MGRTVLSGGPYARADSVLRRTAFSGRSSKELPVKVNVSVVHIFDTDYCIWVCVYGPGMDLPPSLSLFGLGPTPHSLSGLGPPPTLTPWPDPESTPPSLTHSIHFTQIVISMLLLQSDSDMWLSQVELRS